PHGDGRNQSFQRRTAARRSNASASRSAASVDAVFWDHDNERLLAPHFPALRNPQDGHSSVKIIRDMSAFPPESRGGAVTIGNFDGVHRGHARIIECLIARARAVGGPAVVFTFDPHPVRLL